MSVCAGSSEDLYRDQHIVLVPLIFTADLGLGLVTCPVLALTGISAVIRRRMIRAVCPQPRPPPTR